MTDNAFSDIKYWANRLEDELKNADEIRRKLYCIPIEPFTIEEMIALREAFAQFQATSTLLGEAVARLEIENKKPFYKKLLKK